MYQPMSVVITAFKETDVKNPLKGFGVLIPRKEQNNGFFTLGMFLIGKISYLYLLLVVAMAAQQEIPTPTILSLVCSGTLFSSSMFPDRAPPGQVVFTTFVGGSRSRALASAPL